MGDDWLEKGLIGHKYLWRTKLALLVGSGLKILIDGRSGNTVVVSPIN